MHDTKIRPKVNLRYVSRALLTVFAIAIVFSAGYYFGIQGYQVRANGYPKVTISRDLPVAQGDLDFSLFWKVWDTLQGKYYNEDQIIPAKLVYGAIGGMVSAVGDPYTIFLPPQENKIVQEDLQGNFSGVGIQIGFRGSQLAVIAPLPGSPAEIAGIKAGDFIVGILDEVKSIDRGTAGISLPDAVQAIRGPAGSKVTLFLTREGVDDPLEIEVTRQNIDVPSVTLDYVGDGGRIAHIKVLKFAGETQAEWDKAVIEIVKKPDIAGVIVDVRNNPGGFLQGAIDMASDFLEVGDVAVIEEARDFDQEYKVERIGRLRSTPVVVLMNKGSASASEIFAGALRDQKKVQLVGETSFGKGTIQEPEQVDGGAGLHITIARWLTPSKFWVNDKGLEPDVTVEDNPDTPEDEQLMEAVKLIQ